MDTFGFGVVPEVRHRNLQHSDVVLDGTNYIPWRLTVKRILDGLRVLGHADGTAITPVAPYLSETSSSSLEATDGSSSISPAVLEAFEKKLEKCATDDSTAKMVVCQTVTLEIRSEIADLPTAHEMWTYLESRYCGSSQAQLYKLYQSLSSMQQGEDTVD